MSREEIKTQIESVLDSFSDNALEDLLSFLKEVSQKKNESFLNAAHLEKILSEDEGLLQKLAQ